MLELESIVVRYGDFELKGHATVKTNRIVAVIGPSGAGKSTLISAIAGFIPVSSGKIRWNGENISEHLPADRPIAMLFQDNNLFPHLTIAQNVGIGLRADLRLSKSQKQIVADALVRVGLAQMGERKPSQVSGGQQSRAALARILVQRRPLVLLDEPFAALGPALRREMLDLVSELARETAATVLMVSHAPADARQIADEIILVANGVFYDSVVAGELLDNPPAVLRDYLG